MGKRGPQPDFKKYQVIVSLREMGRTFAQIGNAVGISRQRAHRIYWDAKHARETMRVLEQMGRKLT